MWTPENRCRYNRDKLHYPSDLTDDEWSHTEHRIPPAKHGARGREVDVREGVIGLMYVLSTSRQWRYVSKGPSGVLCTVTSNAGSTTELRGKSITPSTSNSAGR